MRHLVPLLVIATLLAGCATTAESGSGDSRTYFGFGDTGNIQLRSTLPFEVCTTETEGYTPNSLSEDGRHCTVLGQPGAMHSASLRYMSAPTHLVWVRMEGDEDWFTITIPRCDPRRRGACVSEEFDVLLHEDRWTCNTRFERHSSCRGQRFTRGRYQ